MSEQLQIKTATRQGVKPIIGIYGASGTGKTYSALLLARGIVGPHGRIILCDSESGRGSLYADVLPGGYDTIDLEAPFSPERYIAAIDAVEASGAAIGCLDSTSHEWENLGGVLDMAAQNEERSGKPGLHCWRQPKASHAKFVLRLMRSKIPWIICLRAKHKSRQVKNDRGKTEIVRDDYASPIQAEDFIFELTAHLEVMPDHTIHLTKHSHPTLKECFPEDFKEPISIKHGEAIAAWCAGGGAKSKPQPQTVSQPSSTSEDIAGQCKRLRATLWSMVKSKFQNGGQLVGWLVDEAIISDSEVLEDMGVTRLNQIIDKVKANPPQ